MNPVVCCSEVHEHFVMIPEAIQKYIREVKDELFMLRDWSESELPAEEKISFFRETRHAFGRTALLLSGGGSLGTFHLVSSVSRHSVLPSSGHLAS